MTTQVKTKTEIKVGYLDPNQTYWIKGEQMEIECLMLSDNDGSTRSKVKSTGRIIFPNFHKIVLIESK